MPPRWLVADRRLPTAQKMIAEENDRETVKLRLELEANGIRISLDDAREVTTEERALIAEVHSRLRSGWGNAQPAPEPEETSDDDQSDDDAVVAEVNQFLASVGGHITADQLRHGREATATAEREIKERNKKRSQIAPLVTARRPAGPTKPAPRINAQEIYKLRQPRSDA